jgi:hypothetical protein
MRTVGSAGGAVGSDGSDMPLVRSVRDRGRLSNEPAPTGVR